MKNVPWLDETWSFYREFRMCLLVRGPLTLWEVCGLSGESGANFEESTPRYEMWVSSLTIWSCRKHSEFYQVYIGRPYLNMIWTTKCLLDDRRPTCIFSFCILSAYFFFMKAVLDILVKDDRYGRKVLVDHHQKLCLIMKEIRQVIYFHYLYSFSFLFFTKHYVG